MAEPLTNRERAELTKRVNDWALLIPYATAIKDDALALAAEVARLTEEVREKRAELVGYEVLIKLLRSVNWKDECDHWRAEVARYRTTLEAVEALAQRWEDDADAADVRALPENARSVEDRGAEKRQANRLRLHATDLRAALAGGNTPAPNVDHEEVDEVTCSCGYEADAEDYDEARKQLREHIAAGGNTP